MSSDVEHLSPVYWSFLFYLWRNVCEFLSLLQEFFIYSRCRLLTKYAMWAHVPVLSVFFFFPLIFLSISLSPSLLPSLPSSLFFLPSGVCPKSCYVARLLSRQRIRFTGMCDHVWNWRILVFFFFFFLFSLVAHCFAVILYGVLELTIA